MDEFRIVTKDRNELIIVGSIPDSKAKFRLPGATSWTTTVESGKMFFHHFPGNGFDIWYSNYFMKQNAQLYGKVDRPVLEFHTHFNNAFASKWDNFKFEKSHVKQYQLSHVPHVNTVGEFYAGLRYDTFDIHFHLDFLKPYAPYCRRLSKFIDAVEKKEAAQLLNVVRFLTPEMEDCIRAILTYSYHSDLAPQFIEGRVKELLIALIHHTDLLDKLPELDPDQRLKAEEVHKIILSDFKVYDSVEQLAQKVGTTEAKLQVAFKQVYGTTVGKFSREMRLKRAHEILQNGRDTLLAVALMTGYNDPGNFSTAFKQYYKYSPGHIHKKMKR